MKSLNAGIYTIPRLKELLHHHHWPAVLSIQTAADFIDYYRDGNVIFDTRTLRTPLVFPTP